MIWQSMRTAPLTGEVVMARVDGTKTALARFVGVWWRVSLCHGVYYVEHPITPEMWAPMPVGVLETIRRFFRRAL